MQKGEFFKRYELKYLLTAEQAEVIMREVTARMEPDRHGPATIRNLYFDTPTHLLIRNSIEKPPYKEKFRIRSYETASDTTRVFAEIKKKYSSVVYKRRIDLSWSDAKSFMLKGDLHDSSQISREITYFFKVYPTLAPAICIFYDREAFYDRDFKVTFDKNIRYRWEELSLELPPSGKQLLTPDTVLMEIKTPEAIPLWMTRILCENKVYKTPFSKYGEAYKKLITGE